jgi:hypothetical protein
MIRHLRWAERGWVDVCGKPVRLSGNISATRLRFSQMPLSWQVVLLGEYVSKLEAIGDGLAFWGTPTKRSPLAAQWREVRKAKP